MRRDEIDEIWEIIRDCEEIEDGPMRYWNSAKMCQREGDDGGLLRKSGAGDCTDRFPGSYCSYSSDVGGGVKEWVSTSGLMCLRRAIRPNGC